jgi:hypothetical protein
MLTGPSIVGEVQNLAAFCPAKPGESDREGELLK